MLTLAEMDLDLHLAANSLAELRLFLPTDALALPASRPCVIEAHLNKVGAKWTASRMRATVGRTDLSGDLSFSDEPEAGRRPIVRATLSSAVVDADDIGPLIGLGSSPSEGDRVLQRPFNATRLQTFDAEIELRIARLITAVPGSAQSLRMRATLQGGVLNINPFDLGIAGGHATGTLRVEARTPAEVALDVELRGLRLGQFSPAGTPRMAGELRGRIALRSHGDSIAALAGAASGSLSAALSGATISNRLDAKLGLDGGGFLRALFTGTEQVPVQCAALVVDFKRGNGKIRHLLFETERTALVGSGSAYLAQESLDVVLTPHSKKSALLALHKAMHVSGSSRDAKVALVDRRDAPRPAHCEIDRHVPVAQLAPVHRSEQPR
jgi:AsmA family protein